MGNCRGIQDNDENTMTNIFEDKYNQLNNHINKYLTMPVAYLHTPDDATAAIPSSTIL